MQKSDFEYGKGHFDLQYIDIKNIAKYLAMQNIIFPRTIKLYSYKWIFCTYSNHEWAVCIE